MGYELIQVQAPQTKMRCLFFYVTLYAINHLLLNA